MIMNPKLVNISKQIIFSTFVQLWGDLIVFRSITFNYGVKSEVIWKGIK